jgi:hypothetical protein
MAWTAFPTWVVGQVSLASDWNTYVAGNMNFLATPPSGRVWGSGGTSVTGSFTTIGMTNTSYLKNGMTTDGSTGLVVPTTGRYRIVAVVTMTGGSGGAGAVQINIASSPTSSAQVPYLAAGVSIVASDIQQVTAGQLINCTASVSSASGVTIFTGGTTYVYVTATLDGQ